MRANIICQRDRLYFTGLQSEVVITDDPTRRLFRRRRRRNSLVARREFKPGLVTAGFLEAPSFLSPAPWQLLYRKLSTELTFHSKCINPLPPVSVYIAPVLHFTRTYFTDTPYPAIPTGDSVMSRLLQLFSGYSQRGCSYFITTRIYLINRGYMCSNKFITKTKIKQHENVRPKNYSKITIFCQQI